MRRWLVAVVILVWIAAACAIVALRLPREIEDRIRGAIRAKAAALGFVAAADAVRVDLSGSAEILGLRLVAEDEAGPTVEIGRVLALAGHVSLIDRKVGLAEIRVEGVSANVPNVDRALELVNEVRRSNAAGGSKAEGGAPAARSGSSAGWVDLRPLPRVQLDGVSLRAPGLKLRDCSGQLEDAALTLAAPQPKGRLACGYSAGERAGNVELLFEVGDGWQAELRLAPPAPLKIGNVDIRVGGVQRLAGGRIRLVALEVDDPRMSARIGRVELEARPGRSVVELANDLVRGRLRPVEVPAKLSALTLDDVELRAAGDGDLSGRIRRRLEGMLPSMLKAFPTAVAGQAAPKKEEKKRRRRESAAHKVTVKLFKDLVARYDGALGVPARLVEAMPLDLVRVRRARLVDRPSEGKEEDVADKVVLRHVDIEIRKEEKVLHGKVSFRVPSAGRDANVITLRADAETPALQGEATLRRVGLPPYARFLPSWISAGPEGALTDVHLLFALDGSSRKARVEGSLGVEDVSLLADAVAARPVTFEDMHISVVGDLDAGEGRLTLNEGLLRLGAGKVTWSAQVEGVPEDPHILVEASLAPSPAQEIFEAIPDALVSTIRKARFDGKVAAELELEFKTKKLSDLRLEFRPQGKGFAIASLGPKVRLKTLMGPFVHRIQTPTGPVRMVIGPSNPDFVPWERIPQHLVKAITTTEDATFFDHEGFASFAIRSSLIQDLEKGAFVRGASTVTQQTVKNLFLSHEKTISRKIQEAIVTHALEQEISKERILEIYFNIIEWGPELFGLGAAARTYFGKLADELDLVDCLFLVSLIPAPRRYVEQFRRGRVSSAWRKRLAFYAKKMLSRGKITYEEHERAQPFDPVFRGRDVLDTLPEAVGAP